MHESKPRKPENSVLREVTRSVHQTDTEAFGLIYRNYSEFVRAICLRMLRDPAEAEDASQDAFVRVFLKIGTFRGESALSSWLYRLTTNVVLMRFRRNNRLKTPQMGRQGNTVSTSEIDVSDLTATDLVGRIDLHAAVDALPKGYKAAFILHDVQGYQHKEIAGFFGYSVGNSKSQLHKARRRLRELLARIPRGTTPGCKAENGSGSN